MRPVIKLPARPVTKFEDADGLRHLLLEAVGPYCAYCESPITIDFPRSYRVSTSAQSAKFEFDGSSFTYSEGVGSGRFSPAWVNVQAACAACVAERGDMPGSRVGFERLRSTNRLRFDELTADARGRLRPNDDAIDDLFMAALGSWVWPDTSSDENGLIVLIGDDTWNLFTFDVSAQTQVQLADRALVRLDSLERDQSWATQSQTKVWLVPNTTFIQAQTNAADLQARVTNTILGWNLNYSNPSSPTAEDRRVDNRTAALQTANLALTHLSELVRQVSTQNNVGARDEDLEHTRIATLAVFIRETLRATGFWSLWAQTFVSTINNSSDPRWSVYSTSARRLLLYELFVEYEIDRRAIGPIRESKFAPIPADVLEHDIQTQMVFPGTDLDRIPF
jgi:hypothetical protein